MILLFVGAVLTGSEPSRAIPPSYIDSTEIIQLSSTSIAIPAPAGIADGDCLLATVISENPATISPPAGWSQQFHEKRKPVFIGE